MKLDEFLARVLAARKMSLVNDDYGMKLPDDLWRQALPDANHLIAALMFFDQVDIVRRYHEAEDGENRESELKTKLVGDCRKLGAYARRHEDRRAVGLLDMAIKFPGHPHLLAEGKLVEHQAFAPSLRQYQEGCRYIAAGGLCALIGWDLKTKAMFIHPWAKTGSKADSFSPGGAYKDHAQTLKDYLDWLATK